MYIRVHYKTLNNFYCYVNLSVKCIKKEQYLHKPENINCNVYTIYTVLLLLNLQTKTQIFQTEIEARAI